MPRTPLKPTTMRLLLLIPVLLWIGNHVASFVGDPEPERDQEPVTVRFYDVDITADLIVWCLDTSGSMTGEPMERLKKEVIAAIDQLTEDQSFGIVAFSTKTGAYSMDPQRATWWNKRSAMGWVQGLTGFGWTCLPDAIETALDISQQEPATKKCIVLLGDGAPSCNGSTFEIQETFDAIEEFNRENTPIHTIFISRQGGRQFFEEIATRTGGRFSRP